MTDRPPRRRFGPPILTVCALPGCNTEFVVRQSDLLTATRRPQRYCSPPCSASAVAQAAAAQRAVEADRKATEKARADLVAAKEAAEDATLAAEQARLLVARLEGIAARAALRRERAMHDARVAAEKAIGAICKFSTASANAVLLRAKAAQLAEAIPAEQEVPCPRSPAEAEAA